MQYSIFLLSLVATGAVAVEPLALRHALLPRQTDASQCGTVAVDILNSMPTPPPSLISNAGNSKNPCSASIPNSLTKDYSSYSSQVQSWYKSNEPKISSLVSKCTQYATVTDVYALCTSIVGQSTKNAAPRETGMAIAAIAAAGAGFAAAMM